MEKYEWGGPAVELGKTAGRAAGTYDEGLRRHMLRVYNLMGSGLALSGIVAVGLSLAPEFQYALLTGPLGFLMALAPLGIVLALSFGASRMSVGTLHALYWAMTATLGVSLSYIFLEYQIASIGLVFFVTAGAFGGLSLYGYTTRKDLSGLGTFLVMGLIGVLVAIIVNIFVQSPMLGFLLSVAGVLVFAGLIATDTQNQKQLYLATAGAPAEMRERAAIFGAVSLYLNFVNLFRFLLLLMGQRE